MVITLIVAAVYSLLPVLGQAAAPAKDKCFAEFERCTKEDVRTSFWAALLITLTARWLWQPASNINLFNWLINN